MKTVHLGFEIGTAKRVQLPLRHMVVSGQTQEAGKTTTLEALIARAGVRAVTFVTKRGESAFQDGARLQPFFRERADWVFVSSLIDATLGEKNKLLRSWLMKTCRGTKTLAEVQHNVIAAKASARGFSESIYTEIEGYLELVVPQLAQLPPAHKVVIGPGLNVMDLSPYSTELQALVIRSVLEHVYEHEQGVITVIPEAWEFLPEGRGSPVKREAETLIRKGAGLGNYVWLDSQDLAGVWKLAVRAAPVVLIGVQREANEIKRTLANIPAGVAKPTAAAVATLELGEFYACWRSQVIRTYVQPVWMDDEEAIDVAMGTRNARPRRYAPEPKAVAPITARLKEAEVTNEEATRLQQENDLLRSRITELEQLLTSHSIQRGPLDLPGPVPDTDPARRAARRGVQVEAPSKPAATSNPSAPTHGGRDDLALLAGEELYQAIKARLAADAPAILKVVQLVPELEITVRRETVSAAGDGWLGRAALLLREGFFKTPKKVGDVHRELLRRGATGIPARSSEAVKSLLAKGFLTFDSDEGYVEVPGMKVHVVDGR